MRALLPMVVLNLYTSVNAVLDKQKKTVVRLSVEQGHVLGEDSFQKTLPPRFCIEPVKGYRKALAQALQIAEKKLGLIKAQPLLDVALDLKGRVPGDYTGKINVSLQGDLPAGEAARKILLNLLKTMERNLEGTLQNIDSEFLHDFRVAVRRTRSFFSQVKGVLPSDAIKAYRSQFRWLGKITGPTRDLDVYLLKLPSYRKTLPVEMQSNLDSLELFLQSHHAKEQKKLAQHLNSVRCRNFLNDWRNFLERGIDLETWPVKANAPILNIANKRLWKTYCMVLREGGAIDETSPASALHELLIQFKKLRYLMEFFQTLYPSGKIRKQIKALKSLQDNLGDFQDLEVQANSLRHFAQDMQLENKNIPNETFLAMGVLIFNLSQRQEQERQNFSNRFARFSVRSNQRICQEMFYP
jgi:CHAD domain-containing protein